jgi:hypothetical protein
MAFSLSPELLGPEMVVLGELVPSPHKAKMADED